MPIFCSVDCFISLVAIDNPNVWYELGFDTRSGPAEWSRFREKRDHLPFAVYIERAVGITSTMVRRIPISWLTGGESASS